MLTLFDFLTIGKYSLPNRMIMAPLTRGRAEEGGIPGALMVDYYAQRATAGLIIAEATAISPQGYGWLNVPGIWNEAQMEGWKKVVQAVHAKGGRIFIQLQHTGRVSHPDFLNKYPVGPSAIAAKGDTHTPVGKKEYITPHALSIEEIKETISDYKKAAGYAMMAGFDGVELHCANGYLMDQFIRDGSNQRTDQYGGSIENRLRLFQEVIQTVVETIGAEKVGVRLSPMNPYNDMKDSDPIATFCAAAKLLNSFNLAYLHILETLPDNGAHNSERVTPYLRKVYQGIIIANGGYDKGLANKAIEAGEVDAIAFGVPFLANPDLVARFKNNKPLNTPDFGTFYTPGEKGYTDYPAYLEK